MKWFRYNAWKIKKDVKPTARFRAALSKKLSAAWLNSYPRLSWYKVHITQIISASIAGIVLAGSVGTGAYAYTSPDVTEGHPLYPLKQTIEKVEEKTQSSPEAKAQFYLKQLARREAEKKVLERKQKQTQKLEDQMDRVENKLETVERQINTSTLVTNTALRIKIYNAFQEHRERLENRKNILANRLQEKDGVKDTTSTEPSDFENFSDTIKIVPNYQATTTQVEGQRKYFFDAQKKRFEQINQRIKRINEKLDRLENVSSSAQEEPSGDQELKRAKSDNVKIERQELKDENQE